MPVLEVDPSELRSLADVPDRPEDELLDDLFALGMEFEGRTEEGGLELEFAPDRLDRLSVEGIARSLRYQYGKDRGLHVPGLNASNWSIVVDESVPVDRPYVTGAIVREVDLDPDTLASLIQLQEKLHATIGRRRVKAAIGIHDLAMLKGADASADGSVSYRGIDGDADRFVPLESDEEMTPSDVLAEHPTGREYADVVAEYDRLPAIYDDLGLFSFPPVINGRRTEVTPGTRELFIELTGTDQWTIDRMLAIVCYALDARGGTIESVSVTYPEYTLERPDFEPTSKRLTHARIERTLGIDLAGDRVLDLIERSGLGGEPIETETGLAYDVDVPPYRVDVLHPMDIVDDVGRAYGFNELQPRYPDVSTVGGRHERSRFERAVRDVLVGLGFEDLLNFHLIGADENFERMQLAPDADGFGGGEPPRILEPYSEAYEIVRTWALPSLLLVLENNTHRAYPQRLCDIGLATTVDRSRENKVAERRTVGGVIATHDASFEDAKRKVAALCRRFGVDLATPPTEHPTFVEGRAAHLRFDGETRGVIGEIDPAVLVEHDLEVPVAAFEFDLAGLLDASGTDD